MLPLFFLDHRQRLPAVRKLHNRRRPLQPPRCHPRSQATDAAHPTYEHRNKKEADTSHGTKALTTVLLCWDSRSSIRSICDTVAHPLTSRKPCMCCEHWGRRRSRPPNPPFPLPNNGRLFVHPCHMTSTATSFSFVLLSKCSVTRYHTVQR